MLKATILDREPKSKLKRLDSLSIDAKRAKRCKELLSVELIAKAIDEMSLKYKKLDEIDIYNIFVYILDSSKEKS